MITTETDDEFVTLDLPSHRLGDGVVCLPGAIERVQWRSEVLWYLGRAGARPPMLVVAREDGERLLVHPAECETAEGES
ncbi:hypothetical protein [Rubrimonas cliftonensis]|uniref:Uncharacterized protein n=1 Tax=Rubrimonas cliftonensis TaxID=89524 RepID=A0A1H4FYB9_9RHOB|nr:hypothetical protein [Rubrimonas cliftonensis]SEB02339.1 hypothetical protein SAMN05444370_13124 [Rubrimonas cliftonensis]